jgi:hypothetical protein
LVLLKEMPPDVLNAFVLAIERSPSSLPPIVPSLSPDDAAQVMNSIQAMYRVREYADVALEKFISDICESLRESGQLRQDEERSFRERLERALNIEVLSIAGKASVLQNEHEHVFCSASVITDARPVYGSSVSEPPAAMIITHTLKIDYHGAGGRLHEIYIGMGSSGISELHDVLIRADEKAKSLRSALKAANIRFIDPEE